MTHRVIDKKVHIEETQSIYYLRKFQQRSWNNKAIENFH